MEEFLGALTIFDFVVILVVMALFIAGWLQGVIRQLLSVAGFLVAFLLAASLRDQLGSFLARNWTHYDERFNYMLAFFGLWLAFGLTFQVGLQLFYRRVPLHERLLWLDEIAGGVLGALQVLVFIGLLVVIFDSYYVPAGPGGDVEWARNLFALLDDSAVVSELRLSFIPAFVALVAPLLPADVVGTYD